MVFYCLRECVTFKKLQIIVRVVSNIIQQLPQPPSILYKYTAPFYFCTQLWINGYLCVRERVLRSSHSLLLWFAHFPYLLKKKSFLFFRVRPANQPKRTLFGPSYSSSLQNHQHEYYISTREILSPLYSLYITRKCVCACVSVCVYKSMFFAALLVFVSLLYHIVSFSPIFSLCSVHLPFE